MKAVFGLAGLLAALAIGYYIYTSQVTQVAEQGSQAPLIDLVAVKSDLLGLAQSERFYLATTGSYGSMDQLRKAGNLNPFPGDARRGYTYEVEFENAAHFRITAKPSDPGRGLPTLSIDETMQISK
jgi:hypothetical protein